GSDRSQPGGRHDPGRRPQLEQQTLQPGPLTDRQDDPPRAVRALLDLLCGIALDHTGGRGIELERDTGILAAGVVDAPSEVGFLAGRGVEVRTGGPHRANAVDTEE